MASKRDAKKDVQFVITEVISDCLNFLYMNPDKKAADIHGIVEEMLELHNELFYRINHIEGKDNPKLVRAHFKSIYSDLLGKTDEAFSKLSEIAKS
ncbi:MAG TPA: hypothetical protein DEO70_12950 [Bacteroidales bacterium]|nr:MAG: hypothetical protein A2X11_11310 [Bacteroidetes bacterium GWE2_42_24]OFY28899.1 MAG: hypothetical protein A2X09_12855 [Bacteroidetes bacterium GWF2_43_11]PKP23774.1 MAG: hypothetical protein CVU06_06555 [Bacteroidetes bacterium HGW-Bacteroidetes-22]HBZ67737.1 hypothetical protein [Bacteroidales bacterium]